MSEITYVRGDATAPSVKGVRLIAHVCNDIGGWGKGFVLALSRRWPEPQAVYRAWHRDRAHNDFGLGATQFVQVEKYVWVANLIGQRGVLPQGLGFARPGRTPMGSKGVPVRYESIDTGLAHVATKAAELGASVHMPRIGCGLAGGDWSRVEPLIMRRLVERGVAVTVYDHGE
ncbi:macro domain-containing protein [Streptomyces mirabilis]|jgi:O-acetyl-ADP-ribose deacetylase (regulator of RNase III)|uniref:O-acetyl-ADP-ribose deacetylase (Regulator of RNase III), contains Macro domain n=1 Tax=Streptomyces mirabilis TaxID=68239 RepID=A0A1I2M0S1_9ACTN|nr:macro domain-containing protein [Streptomyces mirabilis]SFF82996.1 O-acetyl-ADP-ribose deacetylase (regulator of RNase III), contains Macro domain [Streptomyces mirabilis]